MQTNCMFLLSKSPYLFRQTIGNNCSLGDRNEVFSFNDLNQISVLQIRFYSLWLVTCPYLLS